MVNKTSSCLVSQYYWLCIPIILLGLSVLLVVYTNHIAWSLTVLLVVYTNHIAWSLSTIGFVYQSYCLVSQYYWLCIPIILLGLSVLLVVYTNHIAWSLKQYDWYTKPIVLLVVYTNHIAWSLSTAGCVYQSYCLVSQYYWLCIPIILPWSLSTTGCVYQSYCLVSQYYWFCIPIILLGLSVLPSNMIGIHNQLY